MPKRSRSSGFLLCSELSCISQSLVSLLVRVVSQAATVQEICIATIGGRRKKSKRMPFKAAHEHRKYYRCLSLGARCKARFAQKLWGSWLFASCPLLHVADYAKKKPDATQSGVQYCSSWKQISVILHPVCT